MSAFGKFGSAAGESTALCGVLLTMQYKVLMIVWLAKLGLGLSSAREKDFQEESGKKSFEPAFLLLRFKVMVLLSERHCKQYAREILTTA